MYKNKSIKNWSVEDRPREKMAQRGQLALTDAELIAILLSTGTRELSAIDLARQMLQTFGGINQLAKATIKELTLIKGIGKAKAISIMAAFELGKRKELEEHQPQQFTNAGTTARYLKPLLQDLEHEVFYLLFLNQNSFVVGEKLISSGGVNATVVDPRLIFREAVRHLASSIIVCHNHPSGNLIPSQSDRIVTKKIQDAAVIFDMLVLDHIIVSRKGYFSFAENGEL